MEENCMIYRDPETGKIWQHIGGHEPREIDEDLAKRLHPDIDSIPVLNKNREADPKVICSNCGNFVRKTAFCSECGAKLGE